MINWNWNKDTRQYDNDPKVDAFLTEIESLYRRYGLSITPEDALDTFVIGPFEEHELSWLKEARRNFKD